MKELAKQRQEAILKILNFIQNGGELEEAKKMFQAAFDQVEVQNSKLLVILFILLS